MVSLYTKRCCAYDLPRGVQGRCKGGLVRTGSCKEQHAQGHQQFDCQLAHRVLQGCCDLGLAVAWLRAQVLSNGLSTA
jgi:hypothetical protein